MANPVALLVGAGRSIPAVEVEHSEGAGGAELIVWECCLLAEGRHVLSVAVLNQIVGAIHDHRRDVHRLRRWTHDRLRASVDVDVVDSEDLAEEPRFSRMGFDEDRVVRLIGTADRDIGRGDAAAVQACVVQCEGVGVSRAVGKCLGAGKRRGVGRALQPALSAEPMSNIEDKSCHAEQHRQGNDGQDEHLPAFIISRAGHSSLSFITLFSCPLATGMPKRLML